MRYTSYWQGRDRPLKPSFPDTLTCRGCGETKPATEEYFSKRPENRFGLNLFCKSCSHTKEKIARKAARQRRYAYELQYKKANEGKEAERQKRWFQNGGNEIVKANTRNRRARLRRAEGKHTAKDIRIQYARQKGKCYYCHKKLGKSYHVDHIVPITRGGSNDPDNLVITCHHCNESKNDRLPHEFPEGGRLL